MCRLASRLVRTCWIRCRPRIDGKRPPLFDSELYGLLVELKGFRHVVRHRYGFDLDPRKVDKNLAGVRTAFPAFVKAVTCLERMTAGPMMSLLRRLALSEGP
ncbi:ribonuclease toxin HepT-like protein [Bradyrhizobium sp. USDA 4011]